ncbi:MAG: serine/threonine-protein kinase [Zavarzinella sp.]
MPSSLSCSRCSTLIPVGVLTCPSCGEGVQNYSITDEKSGTVTITELTAPTQDITVGDDAPTVDAPSKTSPAISEYDEEIEQLPHAPVIPGYRLYKELGEGGMGAVFLAQQRLTRKLFAVKVMLDHRRQSEHNIERFRREARSQALINHPNVVTVHHVGPQEEVPYFAMEYLAANSLSELLKAGPLPPERAATIIRDCCRGVQAAHQSGTIHRDLKPGNILLSEDGTAKVADFGLAKTLGDDTVTMSNAVMGTLRYMSPQQAKGDKATELCDIFALGATLHSVLTKFNPFQDLADEKQILAKKAAATDSLLPPVNKLDSTICPILSAIVDKATAHNPKDRYQTADDFANDLDAWLQNEPTHAKPLTGLRKLRWRVRKHRRQIALALLILLAGSATSYAVIIANKNSANQKPVATVDPLEIMERDLANLKVGEKYEVVGPTGKPKWINWEVGESTLGTTITGDGAASFQTQLYSMLTLVRDPMHDRYRVSFELRHCTFPDQESQIGFYFGLDKSKTSNDEDAWRDLRSLQGFLATWARYSSAY